MKRVRVLLAEDHCLVRAGIRSLLQQMPDVEVVAEADNGRDALRLIESAHPDIVLMDVAMPQMNGLEATRRVTADFPSVQVLILSMHANPEYVIQALRAGAKGYIIKGASVEELQIAIRALIRGEMFLSPSISGPVVADYLQYVGAEHDPADRLTPRQREVLQLVAEGKTTKEIAALLEVGVKTVETHRAKLMESLDIHDIAGLIRYAIRSGLLVLDE
ncbi:MAG TPA: response regulator transcription factor [Thermoanaerobaculia bacterium]|nr:response regulator transcription factor [Thermoanaerobaculia bacterium]